MPSKAASSRYSEAPSSGAIFGAPGGVSYGTSTSTSSSLAPDTSKLYDVAIVGAGLSGLQCAAALVGKHAMDRSSVVILEASARVGGRVQQIDTFIPGMKIDIGAETLHSSNSFLPEIVTNGRTDSVYPVFCHAQGNGGPSREPVDGGYALYYLAGSQKLLRFDDDDSDFTRINQMLWDLATVNTAAIAPSVPLRQHLEKQGATPDMLDLAAAGFANRLCANLESIPLQKIADATRMIQGSGSGMDCRFTHSLASLVGNLVAVGLDICLRCPVVKVRYGGRLATDYGNVKQGSSDHENAIVCVDLSDGRTVHARKVVITTPVSVLKRGVIEFEPGLPECKIGALKGLQQLPAIKILLKFKAVPWPKKLQALIMAGCVVPEVLLYEVPPHIVAKNVKTDPNTAVCYCTGFCTADFATRAAAMTKDDLVQAFLQQLDDAFSKMQARHVVATVEDAAALVEVPTFPKPSSVCVGSKVIIWDESNPYVGGGFSSYVVEAPGPDHSDGHLRAPVADKLFFAGEATTKGKAGCIKGALVSGIIAAEKVHESLAKPRLTDAIDRYFRFSEEATVVGFGSLLSEPSARSTFPNLRDFRVVRVRGYRRVFAHTPSVFVERGLVNPGSLFQSSLSAEPVYIRDEDGSLKQDLSVGFLAVCFSIPLNDVTHSLGFQGMGGRQWCGEALLKREEEFNFDIVPCHKITKKSVDTTTPSGAQKNASCGYIVDPDAQSIPGLMCVAASDKDYIERWGEEPFRSKLDKTGHSTIWGWSRESGLKPCSVYFTHCYLAAQSLGTHVFDSFLDETYLVDRKTTVRMYISRHPDVLFNQPPPIHESRYMSPPSTPRKRDGGGEGGAASSSVAAGTTPGSPSRSGTRGASSDKGGSGVVSPPSVWQRNQSALLLGGFALAAVVASAFVLVRKK